MALTPRIAIGVLVLLLAAPPLAAQDHDEDEELRGLRPGLAARYTDREGRSAR